ncbi:MAG TPA: glycerol-3-phosphate 1-O-acyltransferase PlsY [Bauldia sp.]
MNWGNVPTDIVGLVIGYVLGSIPFGLILTRLAGLGDIRAIGSGNIGATNVLRTGNRPLAAGTLLLDGLKGTVAVLLGGAIGGPAVAILAALGAFLGHLFPVWLRFNGGKGVATYIGLLAGLFWPAAIFFCAVWIATALATRLSSASALLASLLAPILLFFIANGTLAALFAALSALLWWRHAENIRRLLAGTETKIGEKR